MSDLLTTTGAVFSDCRTYRYRLWRHWDGEKPAVCWIMLNPSTADEVTNDPTVERCERRARAWGYGGLQVVNLFGLRSTDPKLLYRHADPVGPKNDEAIMLACLEAGLVLCAWGANGCHQRRGERVLGMLAAASIEPHCLKVSLNNWQPCHPLYLPYNLMPRSYEQARATARALA